LARFLHRSVSRTGAFVSAAVALGLACAWVARRAGAVNFRGKVVIVTGGSRGLGLRIAEEFARRGAHLAICGRDADAVERAARALGRHGADVLGEARDLGDPKAAVAFVGSVVRRFGRVDVLVNNAGTMQVSPIEHLDLVKLEACMRANFWSAASMTFAVLPFLGRSARIVNVTSIGGRAPIPHMLGYTASKFAMMGFSEGLAVELASRGISVTTVVPGPMRTGSFYNAEFFGRQREEFAWFSVLASLPVVSADATRAARRIVQAAAEGRREVRIGLSGTLLSWLHGLFPGLFVGLVGIVERFLPAPGTSEERWRGREINSTLPGSVWLSLGDRAARANNEEPPA